MATTTDVPSLPKRTPTMNRSARAIFTDDILTARAWYREQHPGDHADLVLQLIDAEVPKLALMIGVGEPTLRESLADGSVKVLGMQVVLAELPGAMRMLAVRV